MATFSEVVEAIRNNKKIQHQDWYDNQFITWDNHEKYLMLSPKQLLSDEWVIEEDQERPKPKSKKTL